MEFAALETDQLIELINDAEANRDENTIKELYEIIVQRDNVEQDLWYETFFNSEPWSIRILAPIKQKYGKLFLYEVIAIQSSALFEEIIENYNVSMVNYEMIIEDLKEFDPWRISILQKMAKIKGPHGN